MQLRGLRGFKVQRVVKKLDLYLSYYARFELTLMSNFSIQADCTTAVKGCTATGPQNNRKTVPNMYFFYWRLHFMPIL